MMTKEQHIAHWLRTSIDDEATMHALFDTGRYTHCLFFGHLYLEKICKAVWIKANVGNTPPFIHNLVKLLDKIDTGLSAEDMKFLDNLNKYQLSGRYPEYTYSLQSQTTKQYTRYCIDYIKKSAYVYKKSSNRLYICLHT